MLDHGIMTFVYQPYVCIYIEPLFLHYERACTTFIAIFFFYFWQTAHFMAPYALYSAMTRLYIHIYST